MKFCANFFVDCLNFGICFSKEFFVSFLYLTCQKMTSGDRIDKKRMKSYFKTKYSVFFFSVNCMTKLSAG